MGTLLPVFFELICLERSTLIVIKFIHHDLDISTMPRSDGESIQDGCYYLHKFGLGYDELASIFDIEEREAKEFVKTFKQRIDSGQIQETAFDMSFWEDVINESREGLRVTLVSAEGQFYHGRRSDLERMKTAELLALFDINKDFLMMVPQVALDTLKQHKIGYNPLLPIKQVQESVTIIESILGKRGDRTSIADVSQ